MGTTALFYRERSSAAWKFTWIGEALDFRMADFKSDNPQGEVLFLDMNAVSALLNNSSLLKNNVPDAALVYLDDGRIVDVFPGTGNVQVYSPDHKHGYEITLPQASAPNRAPRLKYITVKKME